MPAEQSKSEFRDPLQRLLAEAERDLAALDPGVHVLERKPFFRYALYFGHYPDRGTRHPFGNGEEISYKGANGKVILVYFKEP